MDPKKIIFNTTETKNISIYNKVMFSESDLIQIKDEIINFDDNDPHM